MTLRLTLLVRYLAAVLLPLAVFLAFVLPQMARAKAARADLDTQGKGILVESQRILQALPPPRPGIAKRLDAVAGLRLPGVQTRELSRTLSGKPSVRLALHGGYREWVSFLDAAWSLPFPGRVTSLAVAPAKDEEVLEGEAAFEVEP